MELVKVTLSFKLCCLKTTMKVNVANPELITKAFTLLILSNWSNSQDQPFGRVFYCFCFKDNNEVIKIIETGYFYEFIQEKTRITLP